MSLVIDGLIIIVYFVVITAVGLYMGRRQKSLSDFVLGGRRMLAAGGEVRFSQQAVTSVWPYLVAIISLTILTCIYTALGGIKAVIWTDVIQACLMFGGALVAIATLLYHVGGFHAVAQAVPEM